MLQCMGCTGIALALFIMAPTELAQWPQWGGRDRNFIAEAKDLAAVWPDGGPRKIWSRTFGSGHSSLAFVDDRLYGMYREPEAEIVADPMGPVVETKKEEVVVALDAQIGATIWEYRYTAAPMPAGTIGAENIRGPNATPLVHAGKVYAFGATGNLHCLDQKTGKPIWSHDVLAEFGARMPGFGFASSPLIYKNSLILPVGGPGVGVMAFDPASGEVQWKKHDFAGTHSSPILIRVDGRDELVLLAGAEVVGMDAGTGEIEWRYPFESNVMTPLWGDDGILFVSSPITSLSRGSRGLKLSRKDGKVHVEELWAAKDVRVGYTNAVRLGKFILACSGEDDDFIMTAIDAATGKIAWQSPGFGMANLVIAGEKLFILDNGSLALGIATTEGFELKSKFPLLKKSIWSNPTIVGQRLFARDHEMIVALDLSRGG
jgi:outer membrane protein assembly factor BamB